MVIEEITLMVIFQIEINLIMIEIKTMVIVHLIEILQIMETDLDLIKTDQTIIVDLTIEIDKAEIQDLVEIRDLVEIDH